MNKYKTVPFHKLFVKFAAVFLVFFSIFKIVLQIIKTGSFSQMAADYFGPETFTKFIMQIVIGSIAYGLLMAGYYKLFKK
ncbi:hypothetical protein R3X25_06725 [Lutibacter sp. TH_r2]|uniref:hypothetical protein n=1 Tax=Lutibacter sp. TH_r2 TaxID=3082083 RepID=UPI002954014F|nr:hypothetical protein [Lutibacter sp. TH_r2]MDV7186971.1 hypothetical protein [Lutibacter sp. TH_r2]